MQCKCGWYFLGGSKVATKEPLACGLCYNKEMNKWIPARIIVMSNTKALIHALLELHTMAGVLYLSIGISLINLIVNDQYIL